MNTGKIHLIDKNFQSQHSGKCNLLLRISPNRFSYAIIDQGNDQLKVLFDSPVDEGLSNLKTFIHGDYLLRFHFHRIKISVESSEFTFIPRDIYSESELHYYALFINPGANSDIAVSDIRSAKIRNINAIDKHLRAVLDSSFNRPAIFNQANSFIEAAFRLYRNTAGAILLLQFNTGSFEALILKDNKLENYNLFSIDNADEFNYFLLALIRDFELKSAGTDVILSGYISEDEENYRRVQKYFNNIAFADSRKLVRLGDLFEQVPAHQFFSLISLNLCE